MAASPKAVAPDLAEWLEARLMGAHASKLAAAGFDTLERLRQATRTETAAAAVYGAFPQSAGHRLKLRIGLDELHGRTKPPCAAVTLAAAAAASTSPRTPRATANAAANKKPLPPALSKAPSSSGAKSPVTTAPTSPLPAPPPGSPPPGADDDDEDERARARLSRTAPADADSDDDATNKKRRDKAAASKLFASAPLAAGAGLAAAGAAAGATSPTGQPPGVGRVVSVVPGPPPPEDDDDDDDDVPPPPAKSPTSPGIKPGLPKQSCVVPGPPPPDPADEDDALDPLYAAPYVPQNLPELPDSDHEGPSEEDEAPVVGADLGGTGSGSNSTAGSGNTTPRGGLVVGVKKPVPPAPPMRRTPSDGKPPLPVPGSSSSSNATSGPNGKSKPPRSATTPSVASVTPAPNGKAVPLPPPKRKPNADADADGNTTARHRPSSSDGAAPAVGGGSGGSAAASGATTTASATPRDSTSSSSAVGPQLSSSLPHSPPMLHVSVTGAPESATASPGTSPPSGSFGGAASASPLHLNGGHLNHNKFGASPTHSPSPSVMGMRESVVVVTEVLPPRSKLTVAERVQQLRLAQRAAKAGGGAAASPLMRETSGGAAGASASGAPLLTLNRPLSASVSSSSANAGSAAASAAGASLLLASVLASGSSGGSVSPSPGSEQFPAAALAGCQEDETTELAAGALPTVDSLGSSEQLFKAGRLEKRGAPKGLFNHREWVVHVVVLSRDGHFYWIKNNDDEKMVSGGVKVLRPSVRFELSATDSGVLEIVDGRPPSAAALAGGGSGPAPITYQFRPVEGRSAGQTSKHPRLGTLIDDDADGWLHAFRLQRVAAYNKRHGSATAGSGGGGGGGTHGPGDGKQRPEAVLTAVNESERKRREAAELLRRGAVFRKYKRGGHAKERMVWCSDTCDRVFWGDKTKKTVKGYIMLHELTAVTPGVCAGSKKPAQALSVVSKARTLELEADSSEDKDRFCAALKLLTGLK